MNRWPKYIVLPAALLIYMVAMLVFGIYRNGGHLPHNFWMSLIVELLVVLALFYLLKKRYDKYGR